MGGWEGGEGREDYDRSIVVHFAEEFFQGGIFSAGRWAV